MNRSLLFSAVLMSVANAAPVHAETTESFGNLFILNSANPDNPMAAPGVNQWARFRVAADTVINGAKVRLAMVNVSEVTVSVQGVNAAGAPDGTALTSGKIATPGADAWNAVKLTPATLKAGQQYVLVIEPPESGSVEWFSRNLVINGAGQDPQGVKDPGWAGFTWKTKNPQLAGAAWARGSGENVEPGNASTPLFVLETAASAQTNLGQPYVSYATVNVCSETEIPAQHFVLDAEGAEKWKLRAVKIRMSPMGADFPNAPFVFTILDDKHKVLESVEYSPENPDTARDYEVAFSGNTILEKGKEYNLAVYNPDVSKAAKWASESTESEDKALNRATYQGLKGYGFTYADQKFLRENPPELGRDNFFALELEPAL